MTDITDSLVKLPELPVIEVVDDLIQVYKEFMVIRAALKLKLFDWMAANGPATIEEISTGTGIRSEYMASLMGMLYYLDLVRRNDDRYGLSPSANLHFVSSGMYYQGDVILALSTDTTPWTAIDEYITHPDSMKTFKPENQYADRSFTAHEIRGAIKNITTVISRWNGFKEAKTFLEYGSGHGLYAIAACQLHPDLTASVYLPPGSTLLQEHIKKFGMEDRVIPCGDEIWSSSDKADILLASHSLYPYQAGLPEKIRIMTSHLNDNGLFISNHWCNREFEGTGSQGLYELELALHNRFHMIQDREAFEQACRDGGLDIFQTGMMRTAYGEATIHMATKQEKK